jgi:hypothetical protein
MSSPNILGDFTTTWLQILSVTLFETMPFPQAFPSTGSTSTDDEDHNQLRMPHLGVKTEFIFLPS